MRRSHRDDATVGPTTKRPGLRFAQTQPPELRPSHPSSDPATRAQTQPPGNCRPPTAFYVRFQLSATHVVAGELQCHELMFDAARSPPYLRLVRDEVPKERVHNDVDRAREEIARENRAASGNLGLNPTDPRWVVAIRAYSQLQGSTLTLERRQRVIRTARHLGVRPFDATVIIAIVQDHARRGVDLPSAAGTIALLSAPEADRSAGWTWARLISAVILGVTATAWLIWWLTGG